MVGKLGWPARAGWLATVIVPPAVTLGVWRQFAAHHLAFAAVLGVAYEAVVAVARFAGGVLGDVTARWQRRFADYVDLALQRRLSRFDRDYRTFVLTGLRFIDQKGLATVGPFTPKLADVFIDVSLAPRAPHLVKEGLLPDLPAEITERRALSEFLDQKESAVLAVIGAPGSGKTTLLRHTARQVCQRRRGRRGNQRCVPILLYLRDHAAAIVAGTDVALTDLLRSTLGELRASEPDGWFEQRLRCGECVVLLDGLDEVARPEDRRKVASWAERQIRHYPGNDYVITSRPHGYRAAENRRRERTPGPELHR
jgi:NACHT domain